MSNKYGCLPPIVDVRDYRFEKPAGIVSIPQVFNLTKLPRVKNQGQVSSCVAHATSSILEYYAALEGTPAKLSTNFIYGIKKSHCGHDGTGMYLRDACKIVKNFGDMLEEDCKGNYEIPGVYALAEDCVKEEKKVNKALEYKIDSYVKLSKTKDIKMAIMNCGPVLASVKWFDTFKLDNNDVLRGEQSGDYGYHAILLCGWCEEGFVAQNSWGKEWGNGGMFILPYEIPVREAWQLVDSNKYNIKKPVRNKFMDFIYKIVNYFINLFKNS